MIKMDIVFEEVETEPIGAMTVNYQELKAKKAAKNLPKLIDEYEEKKVEDLAELVEDVRKKKSKIKRKYSKGSRSYKAAMDELRDEAANKKTIIEGQWDGKISEVKRDAAFWEETKDKSMLRRLVFGSRPDGKGSLFQ